MKPNFCANLAPKVLRNATLKFLTFETYVEDENSQIQLRVSNPKSKLVLLSGLNLVCQFGGEWVYVPANGQTLLENIQLADLNAENVSAKAQGIVSDFNGCAWLPSPGTEFGISNVKIQAAPNSTVSLFEAINPYLLFKISDKEAFLLFLTWFAILGGFIVLLGQATQMIFRGTKYFVE